MSENATTCTLTTPTAPKEYGRWQDVQAVFGISRATLFRLLRSGQIKGASVAQPGKKRGVRVFSFASIREYLQAHS